MFIQFGSAFSYLPVSSALEVTLKKALCVATRSSLDERENHCVLCYLGHSSYRISSAVEKVFSLGLVTSNKELIIE
uniref:Uncharacterized protein n=1 Tax=Utricularia reniformis TaxID=192314 RepID=A0A1Y0B1J1_9LAMI|nr:hypothetical protein AEK19_MT1091 [Utricularia reniformis]ART31312.1 hypothetical protein AEK19_MT1091 [Utricularia reniformis]